MIVENYILLKRTKIAVSVPVQLISLSLFYCEAKLYLDMYLALYQSGYVVGRYISIEKHIEKTKDSYYDALEIASKDWHEEKENPEVFIINIIWKRY